jgi:hypothetical protein
MSNRITHVLLGHHESLRATLALEKRALPPGDVIQSGVVSLARGCSTIRSGETHAVDELMTLDHW